MFQLYPNQQEIMSDLKAAMRRNKAVLLQSPTGSGKTAMATDMIMSAVSKGNRMLFVVPRKDLMNQTSKTFSSHGIVHSFVASGKQYNPFAQVYIGMADTMARRIKSLPKVKLVVIDETHYGAASLDKIIKFYRSIGAWVIGLSATPWKMNGQGLGMWYDEMVMGKSLRWLMDNKRLSDYRYFYGKTQEDFSGLKTEKEISEFMESKRVIIGDCVSDYRNRCMGRLHIVRCTSIKHSQMTAEAFRINGIPAMHVDGNTPDDEKLKIFMAYARREILVLTFADLLNFGFDLSQATGMDVCIESGSDLKPSKSLAGQMQFWGRMLRKKPDAAIINDHVNNYIQHGLPCSEREWTLDSLTKKKRGEKAPPTKQCEKCFFVHSPSPQCPECGFVYPVKESKIETLDGELIEADINKMRNGVPSQSKLFSEEQELQMLINWAKKNKYKNPVNRASKELAKRINKKYV
jgi:DNA repair protein RadD